MFVEFNNVDEEVDCVANGFKELQLCKKNDNIIAGEIPYFIILLIILKFQGLSILFTAFSN